MIVYPRGVPVLDTPERTDGVSDTIQMPVQRRTGLGDVPGPDRRMCGHRPDGESVRETGGFPGGRDGSGGR